MSCCTIATTGVCAKPGLGAGTSEAMLGRLLIVACVASAVLGRAPYVLRPFDHDAAIFVYLGKSVCDGDRFGHDVVDNKFPTVGLMTSVCWRVFGTHWPGYVLLQTAMAMGAALLLGRAAARAVGPQARLPTLLAALAYLNFSIAVFGGFQLETLQTFLAVLAACAALEVLRAASLADGLLVGLAGGCATMLKPTGMAVVGAMLLVLLAARNLSLKRRAGICACVMAGLLIPAAVVLIYLVNYDLVRDMPQHYRQIALYAAQTPLDWDDLFKPITVLALAGFGIIVRGLVHRRRRIDLTEGVAANMRMAGLFAAVWFALEFAGALLQRRMYAYHFLPIAAPAALIFGLLPRRNDPLPMLAALGPIILLSLIGSVEIVRHRDPRRPILPVSQYLLPRTQAGDAVWQDSMPRLLLETNLRPGARFPLMFLFGNHDTAAAEYLPVLLDDFDRRRPKYIVMPNDLEAKIASETTQCAHLARSPARAANFASAWRQIQRYVDQHYLLEARVRGEAIYRRRGS